jgi:hypothetical protein
MMSIATAGSDPSSLQQHAQVIDHRERESSREREHETVEGTRFYNGDQALVIKRWLNRVDEDASGLTFEEWDPASEADTSQEPVAMIINSSELRAAGFKLKEVFPLQLESAARGGMRTRGAGLRRLQGMGPQRFLLHVDDDTEFRSRCE